MFGSYKKTIVLGLDYSEFSGGVTECNNKMKSLDAEFALMQSQMDGNSTASEKLAAKNDYLTQKINLQKQKVEEAKKKYNALMDAHADTSKIDRADTALLKERTTLQNLENQLGETQLAQSNLKESATALAAVVVTIGTAFLKCAKDASEYADQILTTSAQTGIATDTLQGYAYAAELVDTSVDTITGSLKKMEKNMQTAAKGSGDAADAFKKLGVKVTDAHGNMKDAEQVFNETIDALGGVKNATEQDQLAMNIFGKSAADLTGVINAGSEGMKGYYDEAVRLGRIMSDDDLEAAGAFDDSMQKLKSSFEALENSLGLIIIPVLTEFIEAIASIPTPVLTIIATTVSTVAILITLGKTIKSAMDAGSAISKVFSVLNGTFDITYAKIMLAVIAFTALATVIAVIIGKGKEINSTIKSVGDMSNSYTANGKNTRTGHNASGTRNWIGGTTWVGENGPERVDLPPGTRIYNNEETKQISGGNTYNVTIQCDLQSMRSMADVIDAVEGLETSAQCGGGI